MGDENLVRYHNIKAPDSKERAILALLQKDGVHQKVTAIAATLNETFSVQTKLLVDIRPGAIFVDTLDNTNYIYESTVVPFDMGPLSTLIFREAQHPPEELEDQGYVIIRSQASDGSRYVLSLKDFIKMCAIQRFTITDLNIHDEKEITRKMF
jgi:hypothetical protein